MICLGVSPDGVGFFFVVVVDDDVTVSLKGFTSINVKVRAETRHDFFFSNVLCFVLAKSPSWPARRTWRFPRCSYI